MPVPSSAVPEEHIRLVEQFLRGEADAIPPAALLSDLGLAAYGATASGPPADPLARAEMQAARMLAGARHVAIRGVLRSLLRAWNGAGIEVLLFKGFHLAEFVYADPGLRHYSDVDLLIRGRSGLEAAALAAEQGWRVLWHAERPTTAESVRTENYSGHEVMQLRHERVGVHVDAHRRLVHNNHNHRRASGRSRQQRITEQAWSRSQEIDWDGIPLRQLQPVDAVLIGLVLNRSWSPEDWELRPHDYLDFRFLVERFGLEPGQLEERALELGCPRTYRIFLGRCDPFNGVCNLASPSRLERQRWNLRVTPERGNRYLERSLFGVREALTIPLAVLREMPSVLWAVRLARRGGDRSSAARLPVRPGRTRRQLTAGRWRRIRRSVHRGLRILGLAGSENRDLEALALLLALRRRSYPATLRWQAGADGVARPSLELDGVPFSVTGTLLAE
jgi:hypothetical protein